MNKVPGRVLRTGAAAVLIACSLAAQSAADTAPRSQAAASIAAWRARRFGMFIHWGPVSLKGTEIGWSRGREIPIKEYDRLYEKFRASKFDADHWARVAKRAGMKYLVITTKHHDGFCLWPSDYTTYDVASTPFGRDVLAELSAACRKQGLAFGTYYSVCDWHHPDFPLGSPGGRSRKPGADLDRYLKYLRNQVRELIENYGPLSTMWFDVPQEVDVARGRPIVDLVRKLQPDIVINNRAYRDKGKEVGDYDTPEQLIGDFDRDRPWETCMTICRQWAWKPGDRMKSLAQCLRALLHTIGGDGNLLLNVGPMPDGRIEPRQARRLQEMGTWLAKHGAGVYATRGGPFRPGRWGASTCKGNEIFLFVMQWPRDGSLRLPPIAQIVTAAESMSGGAVRFEQDAAGLTVDVPAGQRATIVTAIRLRVDGEAFAIEPVSVPHRSDSLAFGKNAIASNVFRRMPRYGPAMAFDDDDRTRWTTDAGKSAAWLEVDLGKQVMIGRLRIHEPARYRRVRAFELRYHDGQAWRTLVRGKTIGPNWTKTIAPVTGRRVRLNILDATEGPTISELQVFGPGK